MAVGRIRDKHDRRAKKKARCRAPMSDKSVVALCHLCRRVGYWLRSRTPDVGGEDRACFLSVSAGYDDSDRLLGFGYFTYLLHCILAEFEPEVVTGASSQGTPDAKYAQIPKSLIFHG